MRYWFWGVVCWAFCGVAQADAFKQADLIQATLVTSMGEIELELNAAKAPKSVANFIRYARAGRYDGTIFHRVIANFMIQGGGFTPGMERRPTYAPIVNEADNGLHNGIGTVAMARTSEPNSATNQFFINTANNAFLDHTGNTPQGWGYAVFGRVVGGMDVVRKIEQVPTENRGAMKNVPVEPVIIQQVVISYWRD